MTMTRTVSAFAPATIANFGPGFDILGAAIEGLGDTVSVELAPGNALSCSVGGR